MLCLEGCFSAAIENGTAPMGTEPTRAKVVRVGSSCSLTVLAHGVAVHHMEVPSWLPIRCVSPGHRRTRLQALTLSVFAHGTTTDRLVLYDKLTSKNAGEAEGQDQGHLPRDSFMLAEYLWGGCLPVSLHNCRGTVPRSRARADPVGHSPIRASRSVCQEACRAHYLRRPEHLVPSSGVAFVALEVVSSYHHTMQALLFKRHVERPRTTRSGYNDSGMAPKSSPASSARWERRGHHGSP